MGYAFEADGETCDLEHVGGPEEEGVERLDWSRMQGLAKDTMVRATLVIGVGLQPKHH
jgi:hypothetical protein